MEIENADKIIAEYMGYEVDSTHIYTGSVLGYRITGENTYIKNNHFSASLDALVPVWEKMSNFWNELDFNLSPDKKPFFNIDYFIGRDCYCINSYGKTIQEAACVATAKAIESLKNDQTK